MCTSRILAQTKNGIVIECQSCNTLQLIYGTAKMEFQHEVFPMFMKSIQTKNHKLNNNPIPKDTKSIVINHPTRNGFSFVLTQSEVYDLLDLISPAYLLYQTHNILKPER